MKKIICFFLIFSVLQAKPIKKITTGLDPAYPPFEFLEEETQKMVGFDIDLLNAIAGYIGAELEIKDEKFDGIMASLHSGRIDFICPITVTKEREKNVSFTIPTLKSSLSILVRADNNDIKTLKDLENKKVGAVLGTGSSDKAHTIKGAIISDFGDVPTMIIALNANKLDAIINDTPINDYYVKVKGIVEASKVKIAGKTFNDEVFAFAIKKDNKQLLDAFNDAITTMKKKGELDALIDKWFGKDYPR
jgi:polar amino acid transport system substrate-binding protein